ncbi:conserved hypothetical protein [Histoplasma capsulatum var. duboisii H88]|uniref:Uncharacterized protein n=1 Tax=Ajellomyces capsulatus (strain H88) TaxID=544711 RepID=F0UKX3_AJEC8|nr:conserved hypothetical protein [Histoplasma capsulatum var. duboisii H88]
MPGENADGEQKNSAVKHAQERLLYSVPCIQFMDTGQKSLERSATSGSAHRPRTRGNMPPFLTEMENGTFRSEYVKLGALAGANRSRKNPHKVLLLFKLRLGAELEPSTVGGRKSNFARGNAISVIQYAGLQGKRKLSVKKWRIIFFSLFCLFDPIVPTPYLLNHLSLLIKKLHTELTDMREGERERKRSQRGFGKGEILPWPPPSSSSFEALSGWAALGREEHWTTKHKKPS